MPRTGNDGAEQNLYRIAPYHYIHVLDQNTNVTRVEAGPLTFIRQDNEKGKWLQSLLHACLMLS